MPGEAFEPRRYLPHLQLRPEARLAFGRTEAAQSSAATDHDVIRVRVSERDVSVVTLPRCSRPVSLTAVSPRPKSFRFEQCDCFEISRDLIQTRRPQNDRQ